MIPRFGYPGLDSIHSALTITIVSVGNEDGRPIYPRAFTDVFPFYMNIYYWWSPAELLSLDCDVCWSVFNLGPFFIHCVNLSQAPMQDSDTDIQSSDTFSDANPFLSSFHTETLWCLMDYDAGALVWPAMPMSHPKIFWNILNFVLAFEFCQS